MALRIEDYGLIGDTQTAALVGRDGSIDWAAFPRFDSGACFAALLGDRHNGRWRIAAADATASVKRRYRQGSLVLETQIDAASGTARVIDFMPIRERAPSIVRIVEGLRGRVQMQVDLVIRFDYGAVVPWVRRRGDALTATGGPDAVCIRGDIELSGRGKATVGRVSVGAGERRALVMTWFPSHEPLPEPVDPLGALRETEAWWAEWSARAARDTLPAGSWAEAAGVSFRVLKALTYGPTGGIVAAPTTSLPERMGGRRNWDYRFCWLRDATMTLYALMQGGYTEEAAAWRQWLLRAAAGDPEQLQVMYGVGGERRLIESEASWLAGYGGSKPVRLGNQAHTQFQLDVYGEVVDALYEARRFGIVADDWSWSLELVLLECLEARWREPDEGIWEVRAGRRQLTHSKVMAWVAFDRAIKSVEGLGKQGPIERWRAVRDQIHAQVCARSFDASRGTFVQAYDSAELDAALLMIPLVGFLPADDPRVVGTVGAIERELMPDGLVRRYRNGAQTAPPLQGDKPGTGDLDGRPQPRRAIDGLPAGEGTFLPCSFWLVDVYAQMGRRRQATLLFERLLALRNDLGLLAEEYDCEKKALMGNYPQALTHLALINSAYNLAGGPQRPVERRGTRPGPGDLGPRGRLNP